MTKAKATESKREIAWGRFLLVFFIAAWMFVLGVLVGRQNAPVHFDTQALQKELAGLRDAMLRKERVAVEKAIQGKDRKAPLEFYEALKKDEPDTAVQVQAATTGSSTRTKAAAARKPPHKQRTAIMGKTASVKAKPKDVIRPGAKPAAARTSGKLTIQVASLRDASAAERIVADLKKKGYPADLSRIVIPDQGLWFRVQVGSYQTPQQAARVMDRLAKDWQKAILVTK